MRMPVLCTEVVLRCEFLYTVAEHRCSTTVPRLLATLAWFVQCTLCNEYTRTSTRVNAEHGDSGCPLPLRMLCRYERAVSFVPWLLDTWTPCQAFYADTHSGTTVSKAATRQPKLRAVCGGGIARSSLSHDHIDSVAPDASRCRKHRCSRSISEQRDDESSALLLAELVDMTCGRGTLVCARRDC
jgi:hypothetical protein